MRTFKILLLTLVSGILSVSLSSCDDQRDFDYKYYLIRVDSVHMPQQITVKDTLSIEFFGTVGTDGCHSFSDFVTEKTDQTIFVEAWGKVVKGSLMCPTVMVFLDGETLEYTFEKPGDYTIKIVQPEGDFLVKQVTLEDSE